MDELVLAFKSISEDSLKNDKALLELIEAVIEEMQKLKDRIEKIELSRLDDYK